MAVCLSCLLFGSALPLNVWAEESETETSQVQDLSDASDQTLDDDSDEGLLTYEEQETYSNYYDTYCGEAHPDQEIYLYGMDFTSADCENYAVDTTRGEVFASLSSVDAVPEDMLVWDCEDDTFMYEIDAPET